MRLVIALALLCGCRQIFGLDSATGGQAVDAMIDAFPPGVCAAVATSCADPDTLRTCETIGANSFDTACGFGCVSGSDAHCGQLVPAGGGVTTADLDGTGLSDISLGDVTINGDLGTITGSPAFAFRVGGGVAIFRFKTLQLGGNITLAGSRSIALVASENIIVDGTIDAQGTCNAPIPGPGGFAGGQANTSGDGLQGSGGNNNGDGAGGGGGGNGGPGGAAGTGSSARPAGGTAFGDAAITTLLGGAGGGGGTQDSNDRGGGGGGAIQLVAGIEVRVSQLGGINAGGCGAKSQNCPNCDMGGGGAGGTILIEGRQVTITGKLAVNGGGGAGAGGDGNNGPLSRNAAAGGNPSNGGIGGNGAAGGSAPGQGGDHPSRAGGGGGGIGRIRLNSSHDLGLTVDVLSVMSPSLGDASSCTRGAVGVQ